MVCNYPIFAYHKKSPAGCNLPCFGISKKKGFGASLLRVLPYHKKGNYSSFCFVKSTFCHIIKKGFRVSAQKPLRFDLSTLSKKPYSNVLRC